MRLERYRHGERERWIFGSTQEEAEEEEEREPVAILAQVFPTAAPFSGGP